MNEIKQYEKLTQIRTFEGFLYTPATPEELDKIVEGRKFIQIGEERIAVHQIKWYGPKEINGVESYILSQTKEIQEKIRARNKRRIDQNLKEFDSVSTIQNFISTLSSTK